MPDNQIYSFDSEYTKEVLIVLEVGSSDLQRHRRKRSGQEKQEIMPVTEHLVAQGRPDGGGGAMLFLLSKQNLNPFSLHI
jgi:hypothetical protein